MTTILVTAVKIIAWLVVVGLTSAFAGSWLGALVLVGVPVLVLCRRVARGRPGRPVRAARPARRVSAGGTSAGMDCRMCTGHGEPCPSCDLRMGVNARGSGCLSCGGRGRVSCRYCHRGP